MLKLNLWKKMTVGTSLLQERVLLKYYHVQQEIKSLKHENVKDMALKIEGPKSNGMVTRSRQNEMKNVQSKPWM